MQRGIFYILQNDVTSRYYIGSCIDIQKRLRDHHNGSTRTTRIEKGTWNLIHSEQFETLLEARERERFVKKQKSKKYIEQYILKIT